MAQYSGTLDDGRITFGAPPKGAAQPEPTPEQAKDVVCGKMVDVRDAVTVSIAGQTYYFCSSECAIRFEADPNKYSG
jgi:YHS domain-containing protein